MSSLDTITPPASQAPTRAAVFASGVRAVLPILLGVVPFGMIYGASAAAAGLSSSAAIGMSLLVFAGAAQLAVVELLARDASLAVIVLTAWVINVRFVMYSVSLASWFRGIARQHQLLLSYLLTDQAYAVTVVRFETRPTEHKMAYYLGTALTPWAAWQVSAVVGNVLGSGLPPALDLGFAIPLTFIALMVPMLTDRPRLLTAVVASAVAIACRDLPYNLGLLVAAASGIAAGLLIKDERQPKTSPASLPRTGPIPCRESEP